MSLSQRLSEGYPKMESITMSESSNTHAYTRLDFLNRACTPGLAINSIRIKVEGLEKGNESVSSKMVELEKEKEAALSRVPALEKEKQAALTKIDELEKEKECTANKVALLEWEGEATFSKITVLEKEKQAASSKIEDLEKEKEDTARKISLLEKELETREEKFGKYTYAQLQKEEEVRTKFENFKRHMDAERKIEKDAAMSKVALLEREGKAAFSKIAVLEMEKQAASSKIEELEKEKEDAARKIALLEKELETMEEKFGKYKNAQLQKEEELRTKFEDFKRHTNAECKIEKEVAMSKIAMLEKELETKEVRAYKQAVRALREIQVEDKEPKEKMNELTITMQKLTEERNYWESLAKQLKGNKSETAELVEARREIIRVLSDLCSGDMDIGIKKFGVIDSYPFRIACKQKFSRQVAEEKATEWCSIWQTAVEDPKWNPFKTVTLHGGVQAEMIDKEDSNLQQLREEWGYEAYSAVVIALTEIKEYNMKGRAMTHQLWNFEEGRKATLKEAICLMGKKLKDAKIKDTAFVKVDQLMPGTEGRNLIVQVINTDVVVDKRQNTDQQSHPYGYSQSRITHVAESLVGDETGSIVFTARNEQVDLMEPGNILLLYGAKIQMYRGFMRLAVEHRAQIIIAEPVEFVVNEDCNKSLDEYEVIPKY